MTHLCLILIAGLACMSPAQADIYVAAQGAPLSATPDGTADAPFATLGAAVDARANRDIAIVLMDGRHPAIDIRGTANPPLEIRAQTPSGAHVPSLSIRAKGTRVSGIGVWPQSPVNGHYNLVTVAADDVVLDRLDLRGKADARDGYFDWSLQDWSHRWKVNGIVMTGANNSLTNSTVTATAFAIQAKGDGAKVIGNHVSGFSGDALRGLGDHSVFKGNYVENCIATDGNHDDGFQSWATKTGKNGARVMKGLVLDANRIIEWTGPADHPLKGRLQGIGMFDGRFEDITVQNNLIVVSQYHGIALYDAFDSKIVNNTVSFGATPFPNRPWIRLGSKKDDPEAYRHVLVANNAAVAYGNIRDALKTNVKIRYPYRSYTDPGSLDFTPKPGSSLLGAGFARYAPDTDITGRSRPGHGRVTAGAFEAD